MLAEPSVASPCIHICVLDEKDICQGCYRSAQEIADWSCLDNATKKQVVQMAQLRRKEGGGIF